MVDMRNRICLSLLLSLLLLAIAAVPAMAEDESGDMDEWTVMFYFCGSDLESKYSYATGNLEEIRGVGYPDTLLPLIALVYGVEYDPGALPTLPKVNVLIETGGCRKWHTEGLGMDIRTDALQRWRYQNRSIYDTEDTFGYAPSFFELADTQPLQSMAAPETLADFIRWGVETCPARKYALVLWDHGGGAKTGLFIDELFDGDVMYLYELKQALADGGVELETVVFDACMMANIETAWSVRDSARWMVASEEVVPGKGTAIKEWLQELYAHPECDGEQLGRTICDMTQIKYENLDDEQARSILTWSVIDLSKIERLTASTERFFQAMGEIYKRYPGLTMDCASIFLQAEEYGDGKQNMRDIAGALYNSNTIRYLDHDLRNEMLDALSDAVVYAVRGTGRSGARGLSFCYPTDFSPEELSVYADNCPSPHYLAFLDAISDWTAPDWVYDQVEHLPEISTIEELQVTIKRQMSEKGLPGIVMKNILSSYNVYYRLYRVDEERHQTVLLGRTPCEIIVGSDLDIMWVAHEPMRWPSINGEPCDMELVMENRIQDGTTKEYLYNIPAQIGTDTCFLRCGRTFSDAGENGHSTYQLYGVWVGYDENTEMTNRSVKSLAQVAGREFRLLYPVDPDGAGYQMSGKMTMYRAIDVQEITLPAGTYYLEYEVDDVFMRPSVLERIEFYWDGENITFREGFNWTGETLLKF